MEYSAFQRISSGVTLFVISRVESQMQLQDAVTNEMAAAGGKVGRLILSTASPIQHHITLYHCNNRLGCGNDNMKLGKESIA